ncbi:unnamed protein product [Mytilus coruscus]|uniref:TRIM2_3 n=1 Tax=Mytilus coruscus TaxID=42192 RepID=A0A6J8AHK0_MYTCO|nr:unnamed protein product [Mytilus coruscus]
MQDDLHTGTEQTSKLTPFLGVHQIGEKISKDTIAISYPYEKAIKIFNTENEAVVKVIQLHKYCCGLSFSNESLAVGLKNDEIRTIDLEGNTLKSIKVQNESILNYLVYYDNRVIYSDYAAYAVICIDGSGKLIWQYTHYLFRPFELCIDTYGNTIVADRGTSTIKAISKDGQDSKVLVRKEDELNDSECICFKIMNPTVLFVPKTANTWQNSILVMSRQIH